MTSLASAACTYYQFAPLKRTCTTRHCKRTEHGILKVLVLRKGCEVMWLVALILSDFPTTDRHGDSWRACRCCPQSLIFEAVVLCRASFLYPTRGSVRATPQSWHLLSPETQRGVAIRTTFHLIAVWGPCPRSVSSGLRDALWLEPARRRSNRLQRAS